MSDISRNWRDESRISIKHEGYSWYFPIVILDWLQNILFSLFYILLLNPKLKGYKFFFVNFMIIIIIWRVTFLIKMIGERRTHNEEKWRTERGPPRVKNRRPWRWDQATIRGGLDVRLSHYAASLLWPFCPHGTRPDLSGRVPPWRVDSRIVRAWARMRTH